VAPGRGPAPARTVPDTGGVAEFDPEILAFYAQGLEADRLARTTTPSGPLELVRTQELLVRFLPPGRLRILDIGGGPGVYAEWLAGLGHDVTLIDPVPLHVAQARARGVTAEVGEARSVAYADGSVDAVLLLGPLYHLVERADRLRALAEARRVVRPGGLVFAAAISRFAALLDLLVRLDRLHEAGIYETVSHSVATGRFGGGEGGLFTTSYLHRPGELRAEGEEAGLDELRLFSIEGPGFMVTDFEPRWADPARREVLLGAARLVEEDPDMVAAAGHLLLVGRA
jgi:SAM-dependent methyltransferase